MHDLTLGNETYNFKVIEKPLNNFKSILVKVLKGETYEESLKQ
jgi:hypothetical protein